MNIPEIDEASAEGREILSGVLVHITFYTCCYTGNIYQHYHMFYANLFFSDVILIHIFWLSILFSFGDNLCIKADSNSAENIARSTFHAVIFF